MYSGAILLFSLPLALGSLYSLLPALLMTIVLIIRTYLEDKTLKKELQGYEEYTNKTRYRLLPGLW